MRMINSPPHLLDTRGQTMPSALIPFCYLGHLTKGKVIANTSLRACNLFDPVVYNGVLCYQTDISSKMPKDATVQGKGLTLIIDANVEKSVAKEIEKDKFGNFEVFDPQIASFLPKKLVKVNIGILAPYQAFGPGNYILSAVKRMAATDGFLSMTREKRECEKETFQSCQKRLFLEGIDKCGCIPQSLLPALQGKADMVCLLLPRGNLFN